MKKIISSIGVVALALMMVALILARTVFWNSINYAKQKADDATNYETIRTVEDTCRSMIASYESDKLIYEQYMDSEVAEERSWAQQAKMRANQTANTYNNYVLQNSFVWAENVPEDIKGELEIIN